MPQFVLAVAITLAIAVVASFGSFYLYGVRDGKIQLAVHSEDSTESDPFDVVQPIDLLDGFPIDELPFWTRVCLVL